MSEFSKAGLDGALCSADATHIVWDRCPFKMKNQNAGPKEKNSARAFEISVNHRRKILASTVGLPGRWNDKTVVRFDGFLTSIHEGLKYDDVTYELYNRNGSKTSYRGAWALVDGGYLSWSCLIPPYKSTSSAPALRWSRWLESMRKDVECTFGILKGRWRILKTGIRQHTKEDVDNIWFTCCALHNMLLDVDGLGKSWENGVAGYYDGQGGYHDYLDVQNNLAPEIFRRLHQSGNNPRQYDSSYRVNNAAPVDRVIREVNGPNSIRLFSREQFRQKLVEHFDYRFSVLKDIVWPSRTGYMQPVINNETV